MEICIVSQFAQKSGKNFFIHFFSLEYRNIEIHLIIPIFKLQKAKGEKVFFFLQRGQKLNPVRKKRKNY